MGEALKLEGEALIHQFAANSPNFTTAYATARSLNQMTNPGRVIHTLELKYRNTRPALGPHRENGAPASPARSISQDRARSALFTSRCGWVDSSFYSSQSRSNEMSRDSVIPSMKTFFLSFVIPFASIAVLAADTCREVVRDASGRIVQTIDRQKNAGGTVQATTRDPSGRIIGTANTSTNAGGNSQTTYRDASGRMTGTAATRPSTATSSHTTYRDASGRLIGSADTRAGGDSGSNTQYRDASGRFTGSTATGGSTSRSFTGTQRDASGRLIRSSSETGKCHGGVTVPTPPPNVKR